ncbi:hypothetical protein CERZMDRAFT_86536 [Cercospora zeae-maydis SCOH1-5]|uniref:Uncharacterized protein n=1 Tax=Cercospora zeae-maydis SCOH1-5 TaxID=717836 RepID=A0A6A6F918_9PEZI|nr:hypothetical protein CERZMDRAFT_86536 [Cercospora zeae-maydis SCOH1-5]
MQYTTFLLSALAASKSLAAPTAKEINDSGIRVTLQNQATELGSSTSFAEDKLPQAARPVGSSGPFQTVSLKLDEYVKNQALRCKILDATQKPIVVVRGENIDTTFADGGNGPWTFRDGAAIVTSIICDPEFVKGEAPPSSSPPSPPADQIPSIRIQLSDGNLARQFPFQKGGLVREEQPSPDQSSPFNTVSLTLDAAVENQALRCQILDQRNQPITLQRGENIDITFADGGNGPWSFLHPEESQVSKVVCDPEFEAKA